MNHRRSSIFVLLSAAALAAPIVSTLACSSSGSTDPVPAGDAAAAVPEAAASADASEAEAAACSITRSYGGPSCNECMVEQCCGLVAACESDPTCATLQGCLFDCFKAADPAACYAECRAKHPSAASKWDPLESCWQGSPPPGSPSCRASCI